MNSFIAWIGGKKLLRKAILEEFPPPAEFDRYIEVFGGAGWVLFGKEKISSQLEVFNDVDSNLINLYRCIKYHCGELQKELEWQLISREQFFDCKAQIDTRGLTDIQRAARYFMAIKISFGADKRTFGTNKKNLKNSIEYLPQIHARLEGVVVENKDFENLISVYDRTKALFYLDPPYLGAERHYDSSFSIEDHKRLKAALSKVKGKFILSYNNDPFITDLYSDFNIREISRHNNLAAKTQDGAVYKEVIIKNF